MIKSMTGFGRCEIFDESRKFTVEMKAVNHRYLDISIRMPKKLNFFETAIRSLLKKKLQRGKVDMFITYEDLSENNVAVRYNAEIANVYLQHLNEMADTLGIDNDIKASSLSRYPEVFTMEEQKTDEKEIWAVLEQAITGAVEQFVETRAVEGENLKADLLEKLENMRGYIEIIEARSPEIIQTYRSKLEEKVAELLADTQIEESRIATEIVLYADKICTDEEIVRLKSHISNMTATLQGSDGIGRKLDFIAQEMNREANTILSKANDLEISNTAIDLKTEIEKVREQIQNIE